MPLPFTESEFLAAFSHYNAAIWPLQAMTLLAAVAALVRVAIAPRRPSTDVFVSGVLVAFWTVTAIGYFLLEFSRISPAAYVFAAAFLVEAGLLAFAGLRRRSLSFSGASGWRAVASGVIVAYAVVLYPVLGLLSGRPPIQSPWLGVVPCPTTILTIGLLLRSDSRAARRLLVIPIVWAGIGTVAALSLGIIEDFGMTAAAIVAALSMLHLRRALPANPPALH